MSLQVCSLIAKEGSELDNIVRNGSDVKFARRAQVILASNAGAKVKQIVQVMGYSDLQVRRIIYSFNSAFVTAPSCTPSKNSVLTGQYPQRLGPGENLWSQFPEGPETYPNILEDNGYFVGSSWCNQIIS